jgi:hypothetical protein
MGKLRDFVYGLLRKPRVISIDPFESQFLPVESHALLRLITKHDQYVAQGRLIEARAMERAVEIVYACYKSEFQESKTDWGAP